MTATLELTRIDKWLFTTLSADAGLTAVVGTRIYADAAPEGAAFPLVIFQCQDPGDDRKAVGSIRTHVRPLYIVKAVDQTDTYQGNLKAAADRISVVLDRVTGSADEATIFFSSRERAFRMAEISDGVRYLHMGAAFRVWAQT